MMRLAPLLAITICLAAASASGTATACVPKKTSEFTFAGCLPHWTPTYQMNMSTIFMACNYSGMFDPAFAAQFGLVEFDWNGQKLQWANDKPMDAERRLVAQAEAVHALNPETKIMVYRNFVKALSWMGSVREKLADPAYAGFFLHDVNGSLYYNDAQTPVPGPSPATLPCGNDCACDGACSCGEIPCGEYLFDHRNASLRAWLADVYTSALAVDLPAISGIFVDDGWASAAEPPPAGGAVGPSEVAAGWQAATGLTAADVDALTRGWDATMAAAQRTLLRKRAFQWQMLVPTAMTRRKVDVRPTCLELLRGACVPGGGPWSSEALVYYWGRNLTTKHDPAPVQFAQDLATFLLIRGPFAWMGTNWLGCSAGAAPPGAAGGAYVRPPGLNVDYGVPVDAACAESEPGASGVFTRAYTKASVEMDCGRFKATITMHGDDD